MAKTEKEIAQDTFDRLKRNFETEMSKVHKSKSDGPEKASSIAYHSMVTFGRAHGLTNLLPLKRKYRKS